MIKLKDKLAVITGANGGIGKAIADRLAQEGCSIALIDINAINQSQYSSKAKSYVCDVSNKKNVSDTISQITKDLGNINILINNAGITRDATLKKLSEDDWDKVINVNLKGTFLMAQGCLRSMEESNYGRIINISSGSALGNFGQANYSASKAGIIGLTKTLALELAKKNITVNAVSPGLIDTEMSKKIPENIKLKMIEKIPMQRIGTPDEAAAAVWFLSLPEASYITGQVIPVNGGSRM